MPVYEVWTLRNYWVADVEADSYEEAYRKAECECGERVISMDEVEVSLYEEEN